MITWQELDAQFKELNDPLGHVRLDIQWGSAGEHLHISGYFDVNNKQRFIALARLAGEKLRTQLEPNSEVNQYILGENDSVLLWYKALWKFSPTFKHGTIAFHKSESGEDLGNIYTGSVPGVYAASATLALNCLSGLGEVVKNIDIEKLTLWEKVKESTNLKPGLFGFSLDLKKLFKRRK